MAESRINRVAKIRPSVWNIDPDDELLTPEELAADLKVPKSWVYEQTRKKGPDAMPRVRYGKYLRVPKNAFRIWAHGKWNS